MREIKFRVWDKDLAKYLGGCEIDSLMAELSAEDDGRAVIIKQICPARYIFEQYTGLIDKNGKEIYEGDIVDIHDGVVFLDSMRNKHDNSFGAGEVVWEWGGFWARPLKGGQYASMAEFTMGKDSCKHVEIIGNIHENNELLGGEE